jgi:hypothetical protein
MLEEKQASGCAPTQIQELVLFILGHVTHSFVLLNTWI